VYILQAATANNDVSGSSSGTDSSAQQTETVTQE